MHLLVARDGGGQGEAVGDGPEGVLLDGRPEGRFGVRARDGGDLGHA